MATRPQRGIEAVNAAMDAGEPTVQLVRIDGVPRGAVTTREFAAIFGEPVWSIRRKITDGLIPVMDANAHHRAIPTSFIAEYQRRAKPLGLTA